MIQSWDYFKMRCSCLYYLFTEPKLKKDKEAGNLSETAKKFLYEVYLEEKYGIVEQDVETPEIRKGKMVEDKIVDILSMVDDEPYEKNMEQKENEWISGEADIVNAGIDEIKAPWSMATLIPHLRSDIPDIYFYQNQGYQYLWGKWKGRINWVVVDCPAGIIHRRTETFILSKWRYMGSRPEVSRITRSIGKTAYRRALHPIGGAHDSKRDS